MFSGSIAYYDRIYANKDYEAESEKVRKWIDARLGADARRLLDVACGTGRHLDFLAPHFAAEGLDLVPGFLETARARHPGLPFHQGDMADFDLGATYDVLTCLFSSIGYLQTLEEVGRAAACFHRHLRPGGLLLVEPWFTPAEWHPNTVHALFIDEPEFKLARINTSYQEGRLSLFDLHHVIGTPEKTEHFVEHHAMGLFETDEMRAALESAGFDVEYDAEGLTGRGLYVGLRG